MDGTTVGITVTKTSITSKSRRLKSNWVVLDTINMTVGSKSKYKIHSKAIVDGTTWYTVGCSPESSDWIRKQDKSLFYEHIDDVWQIHLNQFDIHEKLYSMLALRWS